MLLLLHSKIIPADLLDYFYKHSIFQIVNGFTITPLAIKENTNKSVKGYD